MVKSRKFWKTSFRWCALGKKITVRVLLGYFMSYERYLSLKGLGKSLEKRRLRNDLING